MILVEKDIVQGRSSDQLDLFPNTLYLHFNDVVSLDHFYRINSLCKYWAKVHNCNLDNINMFNNNIVKLTFIEEDKNKPGRFYPADSIYRTLGRFGKRDLITFIECGTVARRDKTVAIEKSFVRLNKVSTFFNFNQCEIAFLKNMGAIKIKYGGNNTHYRELEECDFDPFVKTINKLMRELSFCIERQANEDKFYMKVEI